MSPIIAVENSAVNFIAFLYIEFFFYLWLHLISYSWLWCSTIAPCFQIWLFLFIMLEFHLTFLASDLVLFHKPEKFFAIISDNCLNSIIFFWNSKFYALEHFKLSKIFPFIGLFECFFCISSSVLCFNSIILTSSDEHYVLQYVKFVLHFNYIVHFKSYVLLFFSMIRCLLWTFSLLKFLSLSFIYFFTLAILILYLIADNYNMLSL